MEEIFNEHKGDRQAVIYSIPIPGKLVKGDKRKVFESTRGKNTHLYKVFTYTTGLFGFNRKPVKKLNFKGIVDAFRYANEYLDNV